MFWDVFIHSYMALKDVEDQTTLEGLFHSVAQTMHQLDYSNKVKLFIYNVTFG